MPEDDGQGQGSGQEQGSEEQGTKGQEEEFDKDRALSTIKAQRESEDALKKQLAKAQAKLKEHEDAKLSETERATSKLAEAERKAEAIERELHEARADRAIERAAAKLGFIDPEDAVLGLRRTSLKLEDDGTPNKDSLERALKSLAESKPHLVGGRSKGSWDGGARKTAPAGVDMNDRLRQAISGSR